MRNAVLAVAIAVAVHAALGLAFVAFSRLSPEPDALPTLDLSSVELSLAEKDDETAPAAAQAPTPRQKPTPPPPAPVPQTDSPPPSPEATVAPKPPEPAAMRFAEPEERPPEMVTPAASQPAAAPQQARVDAPPRPRRAIRPQYPRGSRQRGEQGEVVVELRVGTDGHVLEAKIVKSSGYAELDAAAERTAKEATFAPARSDGKAVEAIVRLPLAFRLK